MILENLHLVSNDSELAELLKEVDVSKITTNQLKRIYLAATNSEAPIPSKWKKQDILNGLKRHLRAVSRGAAFSGSSLSESTMIIDRLKQKV
jgi:CRISPR/Cas system CSM-associated protein Csm2 small subunit